VVAFDYLTIASVTKGNGMETRHPAIRPGLFGLVWRLIFNQFPRKTPTLTV
jgi:hypothetical protein